MPKTDKAPKPKTTKARKLTNRLDLWWRGICERLLEWWCPTMSAEELEARIRADTTDEDADRFLPPALRRYPTTKVPATPAS
jgi:hypothetical protein